MLLIQPSFLLVRLGNTGPYMSNFDLNIAEVILAYDRIIHGGLR
jgi:hypothetical protein